MKLKTALLLALGLNLTFGACKKADVDGKGGSVNMVLLGAANAEPGLYDCYNANGEPFYYRNSYLYEWSNSSKIFRKIGDTLNHSVAAGGIGGSWTAASDKTGRYYIAETDNMYTCMGPESPWTKIVFPGVAIPSRMKLMCNEQGDILAFVVKKSITASQADTAQLYLKKATEANWVKVPVSPTDLTLKPHWFDNKGRLYFNPIDIQKFSGGELTDKFLNTNTGKLEKLFDKDDPANVKWELGVIGGYRCILPNGTIYFTQGLDLYRLDGAMLPAKPVKLLTFEDPLAKAHEGDSWETTLRDFAVDASGNIKMKGDCVQGYRAHHGYITGNVNSSKLKLHDHEVLPQYFYFNPKNEVFMSKANYDGLWKWE